MWTPVMSSPTWRTSWRAPSAPTCPSGRWKAPWNLWGAVRATPGKRFFTLFPLAFPPARPLWGLAGNLPLMKHCLVVDDSRVIRTIARRILEGLSYSVDEAEDGMAGLRACRERMPDLIFLDWNLPSMKGLDF